MKLYVMRHGRTAWNEKGIIQGWAKNRLSEYGKQQVRAVAEQFKDVKIDIIFSSPLMRAIQTANLMNEYHKVKIIRDDRIIEKKKGTLTGRNKSSLSAEEQRLRKENPKYFGEEEVEEIYARVLDFVNYLKKNFGNKNILVVLHGLVCTMFDYINKFENFDKDKFSALNEYENAELRELVF